jgi:phage FluMu protein Com
MIEFTCSFCGKALQVADQYAGKQARCPGCSQVVTVPEIAKAQAAAKTEEAAKGKAEPPYKTPSKPAKKEEEPSESVLGGDAYMPSPEDEPDEECRHFATLKMVCGIGGIIAAILCVVAGGLIATSNKGATGALIFGVVAAFFCAVFAGAAWVMFPYLAKIAVYLFSIDKRMKGKQ